MFTTLEPNLGDMHGYILADIPGLIEGASEGKGLGHKFLRHVMRTRVILHCISAENKDVLDCYDAIRRELVEYGQGLSEKREVVALTKSDAVSTEELEEKRKALAARNPDVLDVTILDDASVKAFRDRLVKLLASD
jgi:GTP-binding protein